MPRQIIKPKMRISFLHNEQMMYHLLDVFKKEYSEFINIISSNPTFKKISEKKIFQNKIVDWLSLGIFFPNPRISDYSERLSFFTKNHKNFKLISGNFDSVLPKLKSHQNHKKFKWILVHSLTDASLSFEEVKNFIEKVNNIVSCKGIRLESIIMEQLTNTKTRNCFIILGW